MSLEKKFENVLKADLDVTHAGNKIDKENEKDEEMTSRLLARTAEFFEEQDSPELAQRTREHGAKEAADRKERLKKSTARLERLVKVLSNPEQLKRITGLAKKALEKN